MPAQRISLIFVLLGLLAGCQLTGCQSVERTVTNVGGYDFARAETSPVPTSPPLPGPQPVLRWPQSRVQPATHIQPLQPEQPLQIPTPLQVPTPAVADGAEVLLANSELTLAELEEMAIVLNPAVAEAQAHVDAMHGKWIQVGLPPNTVIGYSGQQIGSHGEAEQQGFYIQQELVRGGKLRLERAIVAREIEIAEQQLAAQQQRVLTDVRLAYYDVLIAQRRSELTQRLVEIANQGSQTAKALFDAKEVTQIDVLRARIERQSAELLDKNAGNLHTAAWSRLAAVLGESDIEPVRLVGDLEAFADHIDPDEALQRLLGESPEMAARLTEVDRARWAIDRSYAEPVPNVDVQAVIQSDNGTGSSNANLQVSVPIPWLNRNQGGIRQAEAELVGAQRAVERLELQLKQRLAGAYQRYASARNRVEDYSMPEGILVNSETTLSFVSRQYQAGEIDYLDLLTAQQTNSETNLAYIESLGELWAAMIEIEGLLLKGSLDLDASR